MKNFKKKKRYVVLFSLVVCFVFGVGTALIAKEKKNIRKEPYLKIVRFLDPSGARDVLEVSCTATKKCLVAKRLGSVTLESKSYSEKELSSFFKEFFKFSKKYKKKKSLSRKVLFWEFHYKQKKFLGEYFLPLEDKRSSVEAFLKLEEALLGYLR